MLTLICKYSSGIKSGTDKCSTCKADCCLSGVECVPAVLVVRYQVFIIL